MQQRIVPNSFNDLHTEFVTTKDGTTLSELLQVLGSISLTPILVPLLIPWMVPKSFIAQAISNKDLFTLVRAILEYPVLIVLPIFIVTLLAGGELNSSGFVDNSGVVAITILCVVVGLVIVNHAITAPKWPGLIGQWDKLKDLPTGWSKANRDAHQPPSKEKLPFITNYRAIVIYITILCILAVDFPIFPRRFSKTKTYGISLMDVGTGCFVFANGIVSPEARNKQSPFSSSLKSTVPVVILGFIRLLSVKGIEYQEVVEEYGVHWNFFFTLAGVKILSSLLFAIFNPAHGLKLATSVCIIYEIVLNNNDFQNKYIMNPKINRGDSILNANREGIFSVAGYLSIYLASVYIGKIITWKNRTSMRHWGEYALQSFVQVIVLWGFYTVSTFYGSKPSRRTANASYVLLMVALNYSLLWFQMLLALIQITLQHIGLIYGPMLFYELVAFQRKQVNRVHNLQRLSKDFAQVKQWEKTDRSRNDEIDKKLQHLEKRLNAALKMVTDCQPKSQSEREILEEITGIENEIVALEENLCDFGEENRGGNGGSEEKRNLVLLPDLSRSPVILEAICFNGLAVFLVGNLLTGLINCMIYTMYSPVYLCLCYLWFYATAISVFSLTLFWYQIQLKFW